MSDFPTARPLHAALHHLALSSPDPEGVATFYSRLLGGAVRRTPNSVTVTAKERCLVFREGAAKKLLHAAYTLDDALALDPLCKRVTQGGSHFEWVDDELLSGRALRCVDPDGNGFVFATRGEDACAGAPGDLPARLQHVVFASTRAAELARFYNEVLGFKLTDVVLDEQEVMRTAFLRSSHEHHTLAVFQAPESRLDHHCYETNDWDGLKKCADRWSAQRIPLVWGPGRHGPGNNLFIFVHDPDGNWVEVSAELETVAADRPVGRWPHEPRTLNLWGTALMRS